MLGHSHEAADDVEAYSYQNGEYLVGTVQNPDIDEVWEPTPFDAWRTIVSAKIGTIDLRIGPDGEIVPDDYYIYNVTVS